MNQQNYTPTEIQKLLSDGKITLVDVREPAEYAAERIPGALLFPLSSFDAKFLPSTLDKPIVFHCRSGKRSLSAIQACANTNLAANAHLAGGIEAWKAAGLPIIAG